MNNQPIIDTTSKQDEYIEILKKHFPSVISQLDDGSYTIDKEQLQLMVEPKNCKIIEDGYGLKWVGKKEAYHNAYIHNNKILKPLVDDSEHFDTTSNILIKGDNLDALKLLKKNYFEKIKIIYIDPPYNTQSDGFIYNDNFTKSQEDVLEELGYSAEQKEYIKNIAGAKTHSGWLSFMYPRLLLARDLLKDDGVIFISIDNNEAHQLKILCDEIFSCENVDCLIWNKEADGKSGTLKQTLRYRNIHEYVIVCYKSKEVVKFNKITEPLETKEGKLETANLAVNEDKVKEGHQNWFELISPNGKKWFKHWKFKQSVVNECLEDNLIYWGKDGNNQPRLIIPSDYRRKVYSTSIIEKGSTTSGRKDCEDLIGEDKFTYPKPIKLISHLLQICQSNNEIILDFFAGSGTTGDAVMQLNVEDGGNRKYILVQLPADIDLKKNSKAYKFVSDELNKEPTIFEITAERLRRAGQKILKDSNESKEPKDLSSLDIGFKVYEIVNDRYNAIYDKAFNEIHQDDLANLLADDNTQIDSLTILTNLLLGSGIALDTKIDVLIADSLYRVDDKLFILKEFDLQPELFNGIEYATIYARYFTNDSFIANLTSFIDKGKIIVKG